MENPRTDIAIAVLPAILSTDTSSVERAIDQYMADDVVFAHPFFTAKGKRQVKRLYVSWSKICRSFPKIIFHGIWFNEDSQRLVLDIDYQMHPLIYPTTSPQQARIVTILHLRKVVSDGTKRYLITRQEDYYPTDSIIAAFIPQPFSWLGRVVAQTMLRMNAAWTIDVLGTVGIGLGVVWDYFGWKNRSQETIIEANAINGNVAYSINGFSGIEEDKLD
ncbi:hypothetical protein DFS34DRAFT_468460 [Phlyctochytrium arcticum]|nr:hypothetical protein DFS34DRAFT_468460 [Phlyctochytrium arcticum]